MSSRPAPRSPHACDRCARLKKKCTGDQPCEKCRRAGADVAAACRFSPHSYGDDAPAAIPRATHFSGGYPQYGSQYRDIAPNPPSSSGYRPPQNLPSSGGNIGAGGHTAQGTQSSQSSNTYSSSYSGPPAPPMAPSTSMSGANYSPTVPYNSSYSSQNQSGGYTTGQYVPPGPYSTSGQYPSGGQPSSEQHYYNPPHQPSGQRQDPSVNPYGGGAPDPYAQPYSTYSQSPPYPPSNPQGGAK